MNIILNHKGFTLVEMAIVMVIVGLLIGMGAGMIGPLTTMSKVRESRETVEADILSVIGWAASNNRLPQWGDGVADATIDEFVEVAKKTTDAWGRPVIYLYDNNLFNATPTKDTICGRKTTAITITDNTVTPAATINNVAFAIISQGEDAITQTTLNGTLNGTALNGVITGSGTATGTIALDVTVSDIIRWVTLDELRSKIGCQGSQLKILNNELPAGSATGSYSAIISAEGGVPIGTPDSYRWCIQPASGSPIPSNVIYQKPDSSGTPVAITNVANLNQADCPNYPEGNWPVAGKLLLSWSSASAPSTKSYSFTVFVRDNSDTDTVAPDNDNITYKSFVLTVNP